MRWLISSLLLPFACGLTLTAPIVFSPPSAQARNPDTIMRTANGTYRCHKTGLFKKKLACTKVSTTPRVRRY